jgi:hypothetical protein
MADTISKRGVVQHEAPPLPEDITDWVRYIKAERTLNDLVEDIHRVLVNESVEYRALLRATWDSHAVEGSCSMDNAVAVQMIRDKAKELGNYPEVAAEKLATINSALGVVLRRYKASRKQRRNMVGGQIVPVDRSNGGDGGGDE